MHALLPILLLFVVVAVLVFAWRDRPKALPPARPPSPPAPLLPATSCTGFLQAEVERMAQQHAEWIDRQVLALFAEARQPRPRQPSFDPFPATLVSIDVGIPPECT